MYAPGVSEDATYVVEARIDDRFNFKCRRCGHCCYTLPNINPRELGRLAKHLGTSRAEFLGEYTVFHGNPTDGYSLRLESNNGHCMFFEEKDNSCKVEKVKPGSCKSKPLISSINSPNKNFRLEYLNFLLVPCKGMKSGPEYTVREWMKENKLNEGMQDWVDYIHDRELLKLKTNPKKLMGEMIDLFLKEG